VADLENPAQRDDHLGIPRIQSAAIVVNPIETKNDGQIEIALAYEPGYQGSPILIDCGLHLSGGYA
jgi:hypothetical protein